MFDVSSGYAWLITTVGVGALACGVNALKYTRVAADGTKFDNGDGDFYKTERAFDTTNITRLQQYSLKEVGDYFGLHYSRVSRILTEEKKAKSKT